MAGARYVRAIESKALRAHWTLLGIVSCVGSACIQIRSPEPPPASRASGESAKPRAERNAAAAPERPTEQAEPPSFVLAAGGDVNLGRACGQRLLATSDYDPLRGVSRLWADADLRFVNLESGLSEQHGETQSARHALIFTGPPSGADALLRARIGVVSTANNHAWDYAQRGLFETLANLDRVGVAHAGTGRDEDAAYRPTLIHVHGLTVTLFAVTQVWNLGVFAEEEGRHHVAWADSARLRQALLRARADSDFVVLSYHGGEEYMDAPLAKTREFVSAVMRLGVDVVIGHHPHVPQGVGWDGERPIFYSLGNLVFDGRGELPWTRSSFLAKVRLRRGAPAEVFACPYSIDGYEPAAMPSEGPARAAFARHLRAISASVGGTEVGAPDALGCLRLTPRAGSAASSPRR